MPDDSGKHRHSRRADLLPVLAVVLLGALMLGIATLWDGGLPDAASDDSAKDPAAAAAIDPEVTDGTRPRNDREERATDGSIIEGVEDSALLEDVKAAEAQVKKVRMESATFKIATFNLLGNNYTAPGGSRASWPDAGPRASMSVGLIRAHGADIVGVQEARAPQYAAVKGGLGWDAYSKPGDTDNGIMWNPAVFELVAADNFQIPYNGGHRAQSIVRLRHKDSRREFYVLNMHTTSGRSGSRTASRNAGLRIAADYVNSLKSEKVPIFLIGDMNDRGNFYCQVIPRTGLVAAQGGGGTCGSAPRMRPVDWITAYGGVTFSGYVDDFSAEHRRISDHPIVVASATLVGAKN
ncbi:endonuclease/exonuclease/phosphatase family protein [Nocardioides sp. GCM10030258]|uniref:endonuclease/exonuclease/phosphatase family protein n=1 Tax=unclassified Nocardioides TaxID=2615069 RepID=UPI00361214A4